jgi:hypothetical protein
MHAFAHLMTAEELARLAGGTIFDRGIEYQREGVVEGLTVTPTSIEAMVMGSHEYQVKFWLDTDKTLAYACTCPFFTTADSFCKHLVAVGLEWIDRTRLGEAAVSSHPLPENCLIWHYATVEEALSEQHVERRLERIRVLIDRVTGLADGKTIDTTFLLRKPTDTILDALTDLLFAGEHYAVSRECEYFMRAIRQANIQYYGTNPSSYLVQRLFVLHFAAAQHAHVCEHRLTDMLADWGYGWPAGLLEFYAPLFGSRKERLYAEIDRRRKDRPRMNVRHAPLSHSVAVMPVEQSEPGFASGVQLEFDYQETDYWGYLALTCNGRRVGGSFTAAETPLPQLRQWLQALMSPAATRCEVMVGHGSGCRRLRSEMVDDDLVRFSVDDLQDDGSPVERTLDVVMPRHRLVQGVYAGLHDHVGFRSGKMEKWLAKNIFVPDGIEICVHEVANDDELPDAKQEIWVNKHLLLNRRGLYQKEVPDCIDWQELVNSVEKNGDYGIVTCFCDWDDCRIEAPYQIMHAGDLTRLRIATSDYLPAPCEFVFFRRRYAEAVLVALRTAIAIQRTYPAEMGDPAELDSDQLLTNVGSESLTLGKLRECHRRIEAIFAAMKVANASPAGAV